MRGLATPRTPKGPVPPNGVCPTPAVGRVAAKGQAPPPTSRAGPLVASETNPRACHARIAEMSARHMTDAARKRSRLLIEQGCVSEPRPLRDATRPLCRMSTAK
ncbi:hypothetical protein GCM10010199_20660 [Dactylosporangium roseum]